MIPNTLTCRQAAELVGVSEQRVRTLFRSGAIEGYQAGRQWITTEAAVASFLSRGPIKPPIDRSRGPGPLPRLKALSFFSGAMGLDIGLEKAGINVLLACESDKVCRRTITANRPEIGLIGDIWQYDSTQIREAAGLGSDDEIDVIVGGPPCQAFSTAGARRGFQDQRGNVFLRFIDLILEMRPRFAVIENVRGLLSAPMAHTPHNKRGSNWKSEPEERPGGALMHILNALRRGGYGVSFNLYNSANFGVPQSRERVVIICSRDGKKLPHLFPTHSRDSQFGLPQWVTLREALDGLDPTKGRHAEFPEERLRFYRMLGPGQYWRHLPAHLHRDALGGSLDAGGGKTGFLRRLAWDKPSCTLVTSPTMPATDICHPEQDRPLSVEEYARIQQFPSSWVFCGSIADQYRQIGNAVPVGLGEAIGRAILAHIDNVEQLPPENFPFSRYKHTDEVSWETRTRAIMSSDPLGDARENLAPTNEKLNEISTSRARKEQLPLFDKA